MFLNSNIYDVSVGAIGYSTRREQDLSDVWFFKEFSTLCELVMPLEMGANDIYDVEFIGYREDEIATIFGV